MIYDLNEIANLPDTFSLEDLRVVCHISKRTARYYLRAGLIPCEISDKKTHCYTIRKQDLLNALKEYQKQPCKFAIPKALNDEKRQRQEALKMMVEHRILSINCLPEKDLKTTTLKKYYQKRLENCRDKFFNYLLKIVNLEDMLPENMLSFLDEMTNHSTEIREVLGNTLGLFVELYAPYLEGFSLIECEDIKNSITVDMFVLSSTQSNATVKKAADDYKKNQIKSKLAQIWSDNTSGTKNPRAWSEKYQTPILCLISDDIYSTAKKSFATLNSNNASESEIKAALEFIEGATFFSDISNEEFRNRKFMEKIVGDYAHLLTDINKIRSALDSLGIDVYEWSDNPAVKNKIKNMAAVEYNAGGSDKAIKTIDGMDSEQLRNWLKQLAKKDIDLGVKIIINGGE